LHELGLAVRELYADGADDPQRVRGRVDDSYLLGFADAVAGELGGKVGIAPRLLLRKLVDVMDRVDQNPDSDPRRHHGLTVAGGAQRVRGRVDDSYLLGFAEAVAGELGGKVGIAPRLFLRKLVDVMDRVDQNPDFDPRRHYSLTVVGGELTETERGAHVQRAA